MRLPDSWPGWDPTVKSLGKSFLTGIFDSSRDDYPQHKFDLQFQFDQEVGSPRNKWVYERYVLTQTRLLK
jgi:hypothetical protein